MHCPPETTAGPVRAVLDWLFRNRRTGDITIVQAPNLLLWIVIASGAFGVVWPEGAGGRAILAIVFRGALLAWAADEVARGVNPWRRSLGAVVIVYQLAMLMT